MKKILCFCILLALLLITASAADLLTIDKLNTNNTQWSHTDDDINTASLEVNFRDTVALHSANTGSARYDNAWYPRITKVKDDLYLLVYMAGQFGSHLYYVTSPDGVNWSTPEVLVTQNDKAFTHTEGPLAGEGDRFTPVNPEACVLKNGEILCVYYIRPGSGYGDAYYLDYNGIFLVRGTVGEDNKITWGEHKQITYGQGWEPYIWQRPDGRIEIYWSNVAPYVSIYGMDTEKRSTGTSIIYSDDNGHTWTPDIEAGKNNTYLYHRAYQEIIGKKVPFGKNADGSNKYTEPVIYMGGQMPVATNMYSGKTFLAIEVAGYEGDARIFTETGTRVRPNLWISFATSQDGGNWKDLGLLEDGYKLTNAYSLTYGTAPYVSTFPSGEIYLVYANGNRPRGRVVKPDDTAISDTEFLATPGISSNWGSSEIVDSHKVLTTYTDTKTGSARSVYIYTSYLNHRINAKNISVNVDGKTDEWKQSTDALFVGSETQAQITHQVAHDKDNVYFLINRLDTHLTNGDTVTLNIGTGKTEYYRIEVGFDGIRTVTYVNGGAETKKEVRGTATVTPIGTVGNNDDIDEGALYEIAIPKDLVGLKGATSFKACPALANQDGMGVICDTLTGVGAFVTDLWPTVVLD